MKAAKPSLLKRSKKACNFNLRHHSLPPSLLPSSPPHQTVLNNFSWTKSKTKNDEILRLLNCFINEALKNKACKTIRGTIPLIFRSICEGSYANILTHNNYNKANCPLLNRMNYSCTMQYGCVILAEQMHRYLPRSYSLLISTRIICSTYTTNAVNIFIDDRVR